MFKRLWRLIRPQYRLRWDFWHHGVHLSGSEFIMSKRVATRVVKDLNQKFGPNTHWMERIE